VVSVIAWVSLNTMLATNLETEIKTFINKFAFFAAAFIPTSLWLFSYSFPWPKIKLFPKYTLTALILPIILGVFVVCTDLLVGDYVKTEMVNFGKLFVFVVVYFVFFFTYSLINFLKTYKEQNDIYKRIIKLLIIGIFTSSFIGVISELILPLVGYNHFSLLRGWIGPFSSLIWLIFSTKILMIKK